jgi:cellulose synthase/poly-beta-1,6-N-acetylglucosamine synthase-like glycosyltransferase
MQTHSNHHIYLVADNADISKWDIKHEKLTVLKPEPALNLKVKSIIHANERSVRQHDYTVIWDADNLAHPEFLENINLYANAGYKAIQGQRTAKNLDSLMAAADSLGEFYKNYIERLVPPRLGSSTVISGSGMAVEQALYESYLYGDDITKGKELWKKMMQEDKILQNHILRANEHIVYAENAICYDEKVTSANEVETQRSRWLFSYFQNLPNSTGFILRGVLTFNWNKFLFGLMTASLPLFILLGSAGLLFLVGLLVNWQVSAVLAASMVIFIGNIFLCLHLSNVPPMVWKAVEAIPTFVLKQFTALFKMANPNKNFKHSEHKVGVSIDDVLKAK